MELAKAQKTLASEEASRIEFTAEVKKHAGSIGVVKKDIEDIELAISKVDQEKTSRDHTIKCLNDEIAENQAKSNEDLISAEEKVSHLNSIKGKLESTLGELEGGLDKEKRNRANLEKEKRKIEGELKMTQEMVADLERAKRELEGAIARKELKKWRRNWKLRDRLVPRLRGRDLTLPEKLSSWENVSWRPEEQPMLKLNLTRREKLKLASSERILKRPTFSRSPSSAI